MDTARYAHNFAGRRIYPHRHIAIQLQSWRNEQISAKRI